MFERLRSVSLLWRILFSTSVAITALFGVLEWVVQAQFVRIATLNLEEEVRASFQAYESLWRARADQLASVSMVLSRMPDVRAAFGTRDQATIRDSGREIWEKIPGRGAFLLVSDPNGSVLASLGGATGADIRELPIVLQAAERFPRQSSGFVVQNGRLFQVVVTPVYVAAAEGSALISVLVAGVPVDAVLARELRDATGGSEFVFVVGNREAASSLTGEQRAEGEPAKYSQFATPLLDVRGQPIGELRILRSFDAARNRISTLRTNLILLWVFAVLAGFGLTYLLARHLLRPIAELDAAAAEIAAGNYETQVRVQNEDEIGRLARTFNAMCASIRSAQEELIRRERIGTIGRLGTSIVHDLRNPLASIYGGSEMLVDDDLSPAQVKRLAGNIYRASRRVQELLQELTDATKGLPYAREACRLRDVIGAACDMVAQTAVSQGVGIQTDVSADIELPLARSPMERVFQNLMSNAVEAMESGGRIRVTAERSESAILIAVEDDGPGVPDSVRSQLFEPFVTAGKKHGMGLGLALARKTVREHAGDLWLDPNRKHGARFLVRLPLTQAGSP